MTKNQLQEDLTEVQAAIYGVALSLDSFLVNGIPYGVLHRAVVPGFLEKTASNLLRDLNSLEKHTLASQPKVKGMLTALRAKIHQLIDVVTGLGSFRTLPFEQVETIVSQVPILRGECVQLVQQLEACLQTPAPFYLSRPSHAADAMTEFLGNLEHMFEDEWNTSKSA